MAFIIVVISVLIGIAMPSQHSTPADVNQSILIDSSGAPESAYAATAPTEQPREETSISPSYGAQTTLDRAPNGHFYTQASVNGRSLPFIVDTGASSVALTIDSARQIGLYVDPANFKTVGEGASGATHGMFVTLDKVEVAGRTVEHVEAVVLDGLPVNLLGQSVLTRLGGVQMNGDKMILR
ncbi:MAG: TIGR02281 family clan AA aspartic protease [Sphingomicrobium sp.]